MQKDVQHSKYYVFIYIACVCVVETFSTKKRYNALINTYTNTPNIYCGWTGVGVGLGDSEFGEREKNTLMDVRGSAKVLTE